MLRYTYTFKERNVTPMIQSSYKSYEEYHLTIGDALFAFFTNSGAISTSSQSNTEVHSHKFTELFYVTKGKIEIKTEDKTYILCENDAALIPGGLVHKSSSPDNSQRIVLSFMLSKKPGKSKDGYHDKFKKFTEGDVRIFRKFAGGDACRRFARYYYGNYTEKHQLIISCLHEIIVLAKEFTDEKKPSTDTLLTDSILYRNYIISEYITSHEPSKSLEELSRLLHLSRQQTHRIIKNMYKKSFSACITEENMQRAMELVKNTSLPFAEIAGNIGYKCTHSFFNAFKKYYGQTPGSVRKSASPLTDE